MHLDGLRFSLRPCRPVTSLTPITRMGHFRESGYTTSCRLHTRFVLDWCMPDVYYNPNVSGTELKEGIHQTASLATGGYVVLKMI